MSAPQLMFSILEARGGQASVKYVARYRRGGRLDRARSVLLLAFVVDGALGLLACAVSVALSPLAAALLFDDASKWPLISGFAVAVFFRAPVAAATDVLVALARFRTNGRVKVAGAFVRLASTVGALATSPTVEGLLVGVGVGMVIDAATASIVADRIVRQEFGRSLFSAGLGSLRGQRRELGRFVAYSDVHSLLRVLATQADVLVLGAVASDSQAGLYRLARQLVSPASSLITPIQTVLYQRYVDVVEHDGVRAARHAASRTARTIAAPLGAATLCVLPFAGPLLALAGGPQFREAAESGRWLVLLTAMWASMLWVQPLLMAAGAVRTLSIISFVATVLTLAQFWVLGLWLGAEGVALARVVGLGVVWHGLAYLAVRRIDDGEGSGSSRWQR